MKELRRESLKDLLQLEDGRILAASQIGDRYWLIDDETGKSDRVTVQAAALLWQRHGGAGVERLRQARAKGPSASLFGEVPAPPDSSGATFRELLRQKLGMVEDD